MATKDEEEKKKVENVNGVTVTPKQPSDTAQETATPDTNPTESSTETQPETSVTGTSDPYEVAMNAHHQNGGGVTEPAGSTTPAPTTTPAPEPEPETPAEPEAETEAEPEPAPAPADNGMPQRGTRFENEARANAPKQYTQEELDDAKKRGKRESRMATAGHIMDTLARVLNFAATTQGAPSAKWSNHNREFDKDTYYNRMKKENEEARKNYFNMMLAGAGQDTKEYQSALEGWKAGRNDARDQARADREAQLFPGQLEAQGLANEKTRLSNEGQELANRLAEIGVKYAPMEKEAGIAHTKAQTNSANASAEHTREQTRQLRENGGSGSGSGKNNKPHTFMGVTYNNQNDYEAAVRRYGAAFPEIDTMKESEEKGEVVNGKPRSTQERTRKEMSVDQKAALYERHAWEHSNFDDAFNFGNWSDKKATTPMKQTTRANDAP